MTIDNTAIVANLESESQSNAKAKFERVIFHLDLDAFFCSVEEIHQPELRGKAFAVAGDANTRGVVSSPSYAARKFGVRSAMPTAQALRLCPKLIVVPHRHGVYGEYSDRVMALLREYGEALQQISVDEAFMDVTGFPGEPRALALELQRRIKDEIHLPASLGVAANKLLAKIASGAAKPNGILVIEPGTEAQFLAPMAVQELWGVGAATTARLHDIGITTIGQLAQALPMQIQRIFGNHTARVIERARGIDPTLVHTEREAKSISEERTFDRDVSDYDMLRKVLLRLSDDVAARLRQYGLYAKTPQLKLRWHDFKTVTRQTSLASPTQLGDELFAAIEPLWLATWQRGERVRLLGVGVSGLTEEWQPEMFDLEQREHKLALAKTVDALRQQYGKTIINRASLSKKPPRPK